MSRRETSTLAQIERDIAWYDKKARSMQSRNDVLALAVCIGATKALRELAEKLAPSPPQEPSNG